MEISYLEANSVAINQLMGFFELNLICRAITHLERTVKRGLCLCLDNIVAVFGFIDKYTNAIVTNFDNTAADRKKLHAVIAMLFVAAHRDHTWRCNTDQWFMVREYRDLSVCRWQNHLVHLLVDLAATEGN